MVDQALSVSDIQANVNTAQSVNSSSNVVNVSNVAKSVASSEGDLHILEDINLSVSRGESVAIVGASGSGKSTLLGILAGLDVPTSGNIQLMGQSLTDLDEEGRAAVRAEYVGFVFQSFQLLPGLTALENVMLPLELNSKESNPKKKGEGGSQTPRERAKTLLNRVGLGQRLQHYPQQLSGGEQQRVAIARAFATNPDILFADEPTGNLDTATGAKIIELLFEMNQEQHKTLILVTHEQRLAERCHQQICLEAGRIVSIS